MNSCSAADDFFPIKDVKMKKTLAAMAVLGAFAGTSMAADVTMYGVVDTGLLYQHGEASASIDGIGSASAEVDSFSMEPGTNSASRFGIRGTEDLGNGMTVGFKLRVRHGRPKDGQQAV